jgi:UDP-N-acetylmuramoylalanine--D-glutamate ligase
VKALLTIGEDAGRIAEELEGAIPCGDLAHAVEKARQMARAGDVVLLSPACASYDQFKNFEDRGEQFKRMVRSLT